MREFFFMAEPTKNESQNGDDNDDYLLEILMFWEGDGLGL